MPICHVALKEGLSTLVPGRENGGSMLPVSFPLLLSHCSPLGIRGRRTQAYLAPCLLGIFLLPICFQRRCNAVRDVPVETAGLVSQACTCSMVSAIGEINLSEWGVGCESLYYINYIFFHLTTLTFFFLSLEHH